MTAAWFAVFNKVNNLAQGSQLLAEFLSRISRVDRTVLKRKSDGGKSYFSFHENLVWGAQVFENEVTQVFAHDTIVTFILKIFFKSENVVLLDLLLSGGSPDTSFLFVIFRLFRDPGLLVKEVTKFHGI